jgi:hypothetical protein
VPEDEVDRHIAAVHNANCPLCGGAGPIDVHNSYRVWSALLLTSWSTRPRVSCKACARSAQAKDALFSLLLGWWGFPWGVVITPIQIARNLSGMATGGNAAGPSDQFRKIMKLQLAQHITRGSRAR